MHCRHCRSLHPVFAIILAIPVSAITQDSASVEPTNAAKARNDLVRAFQAESKLGTHIFYYQAYKVRGRRVDLKGSIFGTIQDLQVDGCELKIRTELVDFYSGSIGDGPVGRTQSKYFSSIQFMLTTKIADEFEVVDARPVRQLSVGTHPVCSDNGQCKMTWIKLKTDTRSIHLTEFTNDVAGYDGDVKDFDGEVNQIWLPVSTAAAGSEIVDRMRAYANGCSK